MNVLFGVIILASGFILPLVLMHFLGPRSIGSVLAIWKTSYLWNAVPFVVLGLAAVFIGHAGTKRLLKAFTIALLFSAVGQAECWWRIGNDYDASFVGSELQVLPVVTLLVAGFAYWSGRPRQSSLDKVEPRQKRGM